MYGSTGVGVVVGHTPEPLLARGQVGDVGADQGRLGRTPGAQTPR
jgi:hypothetical protein